MKLRLLAAKVRILTRAFASNALIIAAMGALVAFGATFGVRWAFLAAFPCLLLLGVGADRGED